MPISNLGFPINHCRDEITCFRLYVQKLTWNHLTQQNRLISYQVEQQATVSAEQIREQNRLNDINRRAQLLAILYDRTDCEAQIKEDCPLQASLRARIEAAKAFAEVERSSKVELPDLSGVDFSGEILSFLVLTQTNLSSVKWASSTSNDGAPFGRC